MVAKSFVVSVAGLIGCLVSAGGVPAAESPNIILFLADDLGADELGCYGNREHQTPNLDRLAAEGLRLDSFYATPLCTPTRVAVMTGQYGFRNGYLGMQNEAFKPAPDSPQRELANHLTHADILKTAGYRTAQAGKWQLTGKIPTLIHDCGFDEYRMWAYSYNLPEGVVHTGRWEGKPGNSNTARYWHPSLVENGNYLTTTANDYGPDLVNQFVIDFLRRTTREGKPAFVYYTSLLTHGPHEETPDPKQPGMRLPAGFHSNVEYLDHVVGQLTAAIRGLESTRPTVLLFVGDNGTAGRGKGTVTEAGVRVPFIAWGPGIVKPQAAATRALGDITDLWPTVADLGGAKVPTDHPLDGRSLVPLITGQTATHRDWIYSYLDDGRLLRDQHWLLEVPRGGGAERFFSCGDHRRSDQYQDVSESQDPAVLAAKARLQQILAAMPKPVPRDTGKNRDVEPRPKKKKKKQAST